MDQGSALSLAQLTLRQEARVLCSLADELDKSVWTIAQLIVGCPGLVWTTGVGTSGIVAARFAHILTDCGIRAVFLSPDLGLHGHSGALASGEVLVAISRGGKSHEVGQLVEIANRRGLVTVAFVNDEMSTLAKTATHTLRVASPTEYELGGYCATASTIASAGLCDAISAIVLEMSGYTYDDFIETHPGGAVGERHVHGLSDSGKGS
jgi:D-arabinose 5-phosphate isomerase GutQ